MSNGQQEQGSSLKITLLTNCFLCPKNAQYHPAITQMSIPNDTHQPYMPTWTFNQLTEAVLECFFRMMNEHQMLQKCLQWRSQSWQLELLIFHMRENTLCCADSKHWLVIDSACQFDTEYASILCIRVVVSTVTARYSEGFVIPKVR